jgi:hypothetical protein
MTLRDALRSQTSDSEGLLRNWEQQVRDLGTQRRTALDRAAAVKAEIDEKRLNELESIQAAESKRRRLAEIAELLKTLNEEYDQVAASSGELSLAAQSVLEEIREIEEKYKRERQLADSLSRKIDGMIPEKTRLENKVANSRLAAFQAYLESTERDLVRAVQGGGKLAEQQSARLRFEESRHTDPEVMGLAEARIELQSLLKLSNIAAVRTPLLAQLADIEQRLDSLFPGCLSEAVVEQSLTDICELFYYQNDDPRVQLFLPIGASAWDSLADDIDSPRSHYVLRLVWALARSLGATLDSSALKKIDRWVVLELERPLVMNKEDTGITMPLPGIGAASLLVSRLPREVEEAIADQNKAN